jgi:hypothetical protein
MLRDFIIIIIIALLEHAFVVGVLLHVHGLIRIVVERESAVLLSGASIFVQRIRAHYK